MRLHHIVVLAAGCCLAGVTSPASAEGLDRLRINGFGTLGLVDTRAPDGWAFRRSHNQPRDAAAWRADVDSRLGLQANYALTEQVEVVAQGVLQRQRGPQPLQLAFVAWRPLPALTVRLGRTNNDVFMYSESRHVGFSYPWARPNHETNAALPVYTLEGLDATWRWEQAQAFWSVHGYLGHGSSTVSGVNQAGDPRYAVQRLAGLTLTRQEDGLQLRGTVAAVRGQMVGNPQIDSGLKALAGIGQLPLPPGMHTAEEARALHALVSDAVSRRRITYMSFGASFDDGGPWIAALEAIAAVADRPVGEGRMGFASVGRRFGEVTVYGAAGTARFSEPVRPHADWQAELTPVLGAQGAGQAAQLMNLLAREMAGGSMRQTSLTVGLRWDLHPRAALKLQLDRYDVSRGGSQSWTTGEPRAAQPRVGSVSLDFVF